MMDKHDNFYEILDTELMCMQLWKGLTFANLQRGFEVENLDAHYTLMVDVEEHLELKKFISSLNYD